MFFLNLSAAEFFALFTALGGLITALYLLDRSKRKKVVSTLHFWLPAQSAEEQRSRKRMREPWSLVLQLAGLLLLLLAIAQLQWGARRRGADHVLLLDTSAWSAERLSGGQGTLVDREKNFARKYLATLPSTDRVMLVRADSLAAPVTAFTSDRQQLTAALDESGSSFSALDPEQALAFARQAESWSASGQGEIVYIGPQLAGDDSNDRPAPTNLRTIPIEASRENAGIRGVSVKRVEDEINSWQAIVTVKNYRLSPQVIRLRTRFAGTEFTPRTLHLGPEEETSAEYIFSTNTAGELQVGIEPHDSLPSDDQASIRLPKTGALEVAAFTNRADVLRPLLEANHVLHITFYSPSQYTPKVSADITLLDGFAPAIEPTMPSLWIAPPREQSPLPVKNVITDAVVRNWHSETALGAGLHSKDTHVSVAEVFQTFEGDMPVASTTEGPIAVARPASRSRAPLAVIGFDPFASGLRFEVTTPLLFANLLRWLSPEAFRTLEFTAGRVGNATITLDPHEQTDRLHVTDDQGAAIPFTLRAQTVELFASRPSIVRVSSDVRERLLSLTLPDVAEFAWKPAGAAVGLPAARNFVPSPLDLWKWLALLGAACLLTEWLIYGRQRLFRIPPPRSSGRAAVPPERDRELVLK